MWYKFKSHSAEDLEEGTMTSTVTGGDEVITDGLIQVGLGGHLQSKGHGGHTVQPQKEVEVIRTAEIDGVGGGLKMKMIMNFEVRISRL